MTTRILLALIIALTALYGYAATVEADIVWCRTCG